MCEPTSLHQPDPQAAIPLATACTGVDCLQEQARINCVLETTSLFTCSPSPPTPLVPILEQSSASVFLVYAPTVLFRFCSHSQPCISPTFRAIAPPKKGNSNSLQTAHTGCPTHEYLLFTFCHPVLHLFQGPVCLILPNNIAPAHSPLSLASIGLLR